MWASETANDIFEAGLDDDHFVLVANSNKECQVAVKMPWGSLTERKTLSSVEMLGGVLTPLKCSVQIDTLGKEILQSSECSKSLYMYKDCVKISPLSFVDDCLTITECGPNSVKMNAYMQSKVNTKKLELSELKCFKMHVGSDRSLCPQLKIHDEVMRSTEQEKYLGDVVSSNTKIDENIKMRHAKGTGINNQIISIIKEVSFGFYYFEMGLLFRNSMLINGIMFNLEVVHNLTPKHVDILEECDKMFMRNLFESEAGTPIEAFFIETATLPLKYILMSRQLMYYHTLLKKGESELVKRVFNAQCQFSTKNDWYSEVKRILTLCGITLTEDEIRNSSVYKFKKLVNDRVKQRAVEDFTHLQMKHPKTKFLQQSSEMKEYLKSEELSTFEKQWLFKMRVRMCPNKTNFEGIYKPDLSCSLCKDKTSKETESHLLQCPFFSKFPELASEMANIKYMDIFSDISKQIKAVRVWIKVFKIYNSEKEKLKEQK